MKTDRRNGKTESLITDYLKESVNQSTSCACFSMQLMVLVYYVKQGDNNYVF